MKSQPAAPVEQDPREKQGNIQSVADLGSRGETKHVCDTRGALNGLSCCPGLQTAQHCS